MIVNRAGFVLFNFFLRDGESRVGCGNARINSHLQEHLFQVARLQAVAQRGAKMQAEFFPASKGSRYGQHQQPARPAV